MDRREFIKATVATGVIAGLSGGAYLGLTRKASDYPLTIDGALSHLNKLTDKTLSSTGQWDPAQIFNHCAQSVELSMTGFAEHKSALFKNTAGQLAFSVFSAKGSMNHGLSEPIPGAPILPSQQPIGSALARLKKSLVDFDAYKNPFAPHFAYGQLSKSDYVLAHVMHINQHLSEISVF